MQSDLQDAVCKVFEVEWKDVANGSRKRIHVEARFAYCFVCRLKNAGPDRVIGKAIGRDRTIVSRSVAVVKDCLDVDVQPFCGRLFDVLGLLQIPFAHEWKSKRLKNIINQKISLYEPGKTEAGGVDGPHKNAAGRS